MLAVGVGQRTQPGRAWRRFAQRLFAAGAARAVLAVPIAQDRATMHLDTVCTMVDRDAVVMYPQRRRHAGGVHHHAGRRRRSRPARAPFLDAAARAMGIDRLRVIDTGLDPVTAEREQWDDGNNTLALAPGLVVAYERNTRDQRAGCARPGIEVVAIAGSELGTGRGGPRCMSCPVLPRPAGLSKFPVCRTSWLPCGSEPSWRRRSPSAQLWGLSLELRRLRATRSTRRRACCRSPTTSSRRPTRRRRRAGASTSTLPAMPRNVAGKPIDPTDWNRADGFSPGSQIVTKIAGLDNDAQLEETGAVPITDLGAYAGRATRPSS